MVYPLSIVQKSFFKRTPTKDEKPKRRLESPNTLQQRSAMSSSKKFQETVLDKKKGEHSSPSNRLLPLLNR